MNYHDGLCDCSCADPCPFRKSGMAERCSLESLAGYFNCTPDQALGRLHEWRPTGAVEIERRFDEMMKEQRIRFTLVESPRSES